MMHVLTHLHDIRIIRCDANSHIDAFCFQLFLRSDKARQMRFWAAFVVVNDFFSEKLWVDNSSNITKTKYCIPQAKHTWSESTRHGEYGNLFSRDEIQ